MGIEKRKHERKPLRMDRCEGTFTLEIRSEFHEIPEVRDISISGMGITLPVYMDPGRPVKIFYAEDDHIVSLTGTVTWCQEYPLSSSLFKIGIFFDDPYRDVSVVIGLVPQIAPKKHEVLRLWHSGTWRCGRPE